MDEERKGLTVLPQGSLSSALPAEVSAAAQASSMAGLPLPSLNVDERVRLMGDGILNSFNILITGLIGFLLIPIMLRGLGIENYGVWIAALSLVGVVGLFDFGLALTVTREVGASLDEPLKTETAKFVRAARNTFFLVGVIGAIAIACLGLPLSRDLHLSALSQKTAPGVFVLAGLALFTDRLLASSTSILCGLRRFDLKNSLAVFTAIGRAAGIIVMIRLGIGLTWMMIWQVVSTGAAVWAGQVMIGRIAPEFRTNLGGVEWKFIHPHLLYGLAIQISNFAEIVLWDTIPLVVGLVLGSAWISTFYVAQKFPIAIAPFIWAIASALLPAISQHQHESGIAHTREILEVGTRWTMVVALPLCLGLFITAPQLLQAWVHEARPASALVLRLITVAVFVEGLGAAPYQLLWGRAEIRKLVTVSIALAASSLGLSLVLMRHMGIPGAGWGLLVPMLLASIAYMVIAAGICQIGIVHLLWTAFNGLFLPSLAFVAVGGGITHWSPGGWLSVIASCVGGGCAFLAVFFLYGARAEEKSLVEKLFLAPVELRRSIYWQLRHSLARFGFLRSGYYFLAAIGDAVRDSPERGQTELNREFEPREDPWDYTKVSYQQDRIRSEVEMLDAIRGERQFECALEVGCAEGLFTEVLATRCLSLLALDISPVALSRAGRLLQPHQNVRFAQWDLRVDPVPGSYDLIVIVHALEYVRNPVYIRRARAKLVKSLRPGGYLLIGTMKTADVYENAWWGRYLLRSGKMINQFFMRHPELKLVRTAEFYLGKDYVAYDVLLQKTA
jgi:O-antigen/teichoic acid export membrane protein/2-polyprenyl-3-methyl-5-hydroxy-6-metoxy-1,4-benzoquinol methylase